MQRCRVAELQRVKDVEMHHALRAGGEREARGKEEQEVKRGYRLRGAKEASGQQRQELN